MVDSPADFYRRIPNKDRKKTILEELYNDAKVKKYVSSLRRDSALSHHHFALNRFSKKRYGELKEINRRRLTATKNMKRLKNKKK